MGDVLEEAIAWCAGKGPAGVYDDYDVAVSWEGLVARLADALAESRAEVERWEAEWERVRLDASEWESAAVENGKHLARLSDEIDRAEAERDVALAAIERVRKLADGLSRAEFRQTIIDGRTVEFTEGWDAACENIRRALDGGSGE